MLSHSKCVAWTRSPGGDRRERDQNRVPDDPMMIGPLVRSVVSGQLVSKTRSYKWLPITGAQLVAVALVLLSTMTPRLPDLERRGEPNQPPDCGRRLSS